MFAGMTFYEILWYFLIYSFAGWCVEVIYHAVKTGKVINRGFLCGPLCPVYGFGVLMVFSVTKWALPTLTGMPESTFSTERSLAGLLIVFLAGVILATAVELFAGWILDMAFHMRWWDYTNEPMNLHGYICVRFSIIWGLAIVFVVRIIQPMIEAGAMFRVPERIGWWPLAVMYPVLLADFIVTVMIVAGLNKKLKELDDVQKEMKVVSDRLSYVLATGTIRTQQNVEEARVQTALAKMEMRDAADEAKDAFGDAVLEARTAWRDKADEAKDAFDDAVLEAKSAWRDRADEQKAAWKDAAQGARKAAAEARKDWTENVQDSRAALKQKQEELERKAQQLKDALTAHPVFGAGRIWRAFPTIRHQSYTALLEEIRKKLQ